MRRRGADGGGGEAAGGGDLQFGGFGGIADDMGRAFHGRGVCWGCCANAFRRQRGGGMRFVSGPCGALEACWSVGLGRDATTGPEASNLPSVKEITTL